MKRLFSAIISVRSTVVIVCLIICCTCAARAVTSKVTSHKTAQDFLKGESENIVISSKGTLQLGRKWEKLTEDFNDVWSINSIVLSGGKVYFGTSPNGGIYCYSLGEVEEIYSSHDSNETTVESEQVAEPNDPNASAEIIDDQKFANEHIFAMATDISGRLLAGISGKRCALTRLEGDELVTIFEPNDAKYIFAIEVADNGTIFLGTGPSGKIYRLDSSAKNSKLVYDSSDKNILSLAVDDDGYLIAGSDTRGLVYRINPDTGEARVLYDSDQDEVTAIIISDGDIYAAATSAQAVEAQRKFAKQAPMAGRPESQEESDGDSSAGSLQLKIANTLKSAADKSSKSSILKTPKPSQASYIYKISSEGFVSSVFSESAVLFALAQDKEQLLLGTGNEAELFTVDPTAERSAVIYKDKNASQITAVISVGEDIYAGTANPARLIKIGSGYADEGTYTSSLVDASQPAKWGKLQIEADIPADCKVMMASRSGNVSDVNDPTFSDWTTPVEMTAPVQLQCPLGRYCQYKLLFSTEDNSQSPVVREVAVAGTIPNLAPKVLEVTVERADKSDKQGQLEIKYKAEDENEDTLVYNIDFRKLGRERWIELTEDIEQDSYEWDSKTVEDGRYEIRVTASDKRSNSVESAMTDSRISDPVVVDNTGPTIEINSVSSDGKSVIVRRSEINGDKATIQLTVTDNLTAIGKLDYTINSNAEWKAAVPDDLVYDTLIEHFSIEIKELTPGEHIIAFRAKDDVGNTTYKSIALSVMDK